MQISILISSTLINVVAATLVNGDSTIAIIIELLYITESLLSVEAASGHNNAVVGLIFLPNAAVSTPTCPTLKWVTLFPKSRLKIFILIWLNSFNLNSLLQRHWLLLSQYS